MRSALENISTNSQRILSIQHMLTKIDRLHLPLRSRYDIESILCRQIARFIEIHVPRYAGHGERTASYVLTLGEAVGLTRTEIHHLRLAALLHDIGILTLPQHIFSTQDLLEATDYALFQSHPRAGAQLLVPYRFLHPAALSIAHHHERWDGYGYPYGLRGEFIPLGARILAVADTFDSLCSRHSRDCSLSPDLALELLQVGAGSQLDPQLVSAFTAVANVRREDFYSIASAGKFDERCRRVE